MKKLGILFMLLFAMTIGNYRVSAQSVTVTLMPGWNWISAPLMDTLDFETAMGSFTPVAGDIIKSRWGQAIFTNSHWMGSISQFFPGYGYMYKSNRVEPVTVTFNAQQPAQQVIVTTAEPTNITTESAVVGGSVTIGEGNHIYDRGVCWGLDSNPNIDDNHISKGAEIGSFSDTLTGLTPSTTYYVRAYVVTDYGLAYGEEKSLATPPTGAIDGLFSVSDSRQVYFSQGNLQFIGSASAPYWKFADHQWDYLGDNGQGSESQYVDRDLFGWGTSGYNHGAICYQPWCTSENNVDYNPYGDSYSNLFDQTGQADWGYNAISNGGNQENQWRTLSYYEWNYLLDTRSTASGIRFAMAQVNNVNGVILLPDNWNEDIYQLSNTNLHRANYNSNIITASEWNSIEASGAVFLPVAGNRNGITVGNVGSLSYYWTSTSSGESGASALLIQDGFVATGFTFRASGYAIRLVHNLSASLPEVSTLEPTNISITTATVGGVVYNNGGNAITECGICWSTEQNPTIEDNHISALGMFIGEFNIDLVNLVPNTTYYVRAYASNEHAIVYGNEVNFTTLEGGGNGNAPMGAINGLFSVSDSLQVYFSQGNLQYIGSATTPYWKFAENQWDYFGSTTGQFSANHYVDRDLFGWGTSGWHDSNDPYNVNYQPWSTSTSVVAMSLNYYGYGPSTNRPSTNLTGSSANYDWGVYNPISNGGNQPNLWRTLTKEEWVYLFNMRSTVSDIRFAKAQVNEVNGVILLPDDWTINTYSLSNVNTSDAEFSSNVITAEDWNNLEQQGAVFLPAAGRRYGSPFYRAEGVWGEYWSTTRQGSASAYYLYFTDSSFNPQSATNRSDGRSVRLVCPAE